MRAPFYILAILPICCTLSAQLISVGVKGGVPLTDATRYSDESRPYVVGPSIEIRLPARFAIEADALYQRIGNTFTFHLPQEGTDTSFLNRQRGNLWEFPILGKYYFRTEGSRIQPFVSTGYAFRTISLRAQVRSTTTQDGESRTVSADYKYGSSLDVGAVAAAGVRVRAGRLSVLPEFRYARWGGSDINHISRNSARFLLGISF